MTNHQLSLLDEAP